MNLREFCKAKGTNIKRVAEQLSIPPTTLYSISIGETALDNVGISTFISVANALGCSSDELYIALSGGEMPKIGNGLSDYENELVGIMRSISQCGAEQLMIFARGIAQTYPKNNELRTDKTA